MGDEQPAEPGAVCLVRSHLAAQGCKSAGALVAWAGQFHHQIRAEGGETTSLLWGEGLPAINLQ